MDEMAQLVQRRSEILEEIQEMRSMRVGSVTEQFLKVPQKGKKEPALRGPYWIYTRKVKGKTIGQRLSRAKADMFRKDVEAYHRFQILCREYADLTERFGELEKKSGEGEQKKKQQNSRLKKMRK